MSVSKKIIKALYGVALVGLAVALLCSSVFADDYAVPDNALSFTLNYWARYYRIHGLTDWKSGNTVSGVTADDRIDFNITYAKPTNPSEPICVDNYTYYMQFYITNNGTSQYYDAFNFYLTDNNIYNNSNTSISIRTLPDFFVNINFGQPTQVQLIFRCESGKRYDLCNRFCITFIGIGGTTYTFGSANLTAYYDMNGNVFNSLVYDQLEQIDQQLDDVNNGLNTVNNNLVVIDNSISSMNELTQEKLNEVNSKLEAASQQQHQDSLNEQQAINDLPANQYNYEHQQDQNSADSTKGDADQAYNTIDNYADVDGIQEAVGQLASAFTSTNKSYTLTFPGSGTVPILNKQLWPTKVIDLQPVVNSAPGTLLIIACNGVFSLVSIVGLVLFIKRVLQDILHH